MVEAVEGRELAPPQRVFIPAPPERRLIAWFVDLVVAGVPGWALLLVATSLAAREEVAPPVVVAIVLSVAAAFGGHISYYVIMEGRLGATLGKRSMGMLVVRADTGEKPSYALALGRYAARFLSFAPCGLGAVWVFFDRRRRTWHEVLTGTLVIAEDSLHRALRENAPGAIEAALSSGDVAAESELADEDSSSLWQLSTLADDLLSEAEYLAALPLLRTLYRAEYPNAAARTARAAALASDWDLALAAANDAVVKSPNDSASHAVRALALFALGEAEEGSSALNLARHGVLNEMVALAELRHGKPGAKQAAKLANEFSSSPAVVVKAAEVLRQHDRKGAAALLADAAATSPRNVEVVVAAVESALAARDRPLAAKFLRNGFVSWPQDPRLHGIAYDRFQVEARRSRWIAPLPLALLPIPTVWGFLGNLGITGPTGALAAPALTIGTAVMFGSWRERDRRRLDTAARQWIDWSVALMRAIDLQRQSRPWARIMRRWHGPVPPAGSVVETANKCHCAVLRSIRAELAGAYAARHLGRVSTAPPPAHSIWACPTGAARWLLLPAHEFAEFTFVRLPAEPRNELGGYL